MYIKISSHALEEFIKDNPHRKNPMTSLRYKASNAISLSSKGLLKRRYTREGRFTVTYNLERFVFRKELGEYILVTYYRLITLEAYSLTTLFTFIIQKIVKSGIKIEKKILKHHIPIKTKHLEKQKRKQTRDLKNANVYNSLKRIFK